MASTDQPLVTIITVTYNSAGYVRETIESVLSQTYGNIEYIIADDCSTDGTWDIIREYYDTRIQAFRNLANLGEYPNRNKAVGHSTGKYLMFIDGDDIIYPHAIATFVSYAECFPECGMFFSREWDPRILSPFKADPLTIYRFEYLDGGLIGGNFTNVLFVTGLLKANPFPDGVRTGDTYIQLQIAQKTSAVVVPGGLAWWRRRTNNATENFFKSMRYMTEVFRYRLHFLGQGCPMPEKDIHQAKINLYGIYLRSMFMLLGKGKISDFFFLLRNLKIPGNYYSSFFKRPKYRYYENISGNKPLHTHLIGNINN